MTKTRPGNVLSLVKFSSLTLTSFADRVTLYSMTGVSARESAYRVMDHARAAKKIAKKNGGFSPPKARQNRVLTIKALQNV